MVLPATGRPTVLRMVVGRQLAVLREKAGLSQSQAATAIRTSAWTVRRIERAEGALKLTHVKGLLHAYGVTDTAEVSSFLDLAREANKPGWWNGYADVVPAWFRVYLGLEQDAEMIRGFEPQCVPGLLQTPEYARALFSASHPGISQADIDRKVAVRMRRQAILARPNPPWLWLVIDESALYRPVGGAVVMRAQLGHLIEVLALPRVTMQVMPMRVPYPATFCMFYLLRFGVPELPDIAYCESLASASYLDKPAEVAAYAQGMDRLCGLAAPAEKTSAILSQLRALY